MNDGHMAVVAEGGVLLTTSDTVTDAEITGREEAVRAALNLLEHDRVSWNLDGTVSLKTTSLCG